MSVVQTRPDVFRDGHFQPGRSQRVWGRFWELLLVCSLPICRNEKWSFQNYYICNAVCRKYTNIVYSMHKLTSLRFVYTHVVSCNLICVVRPKLKPLQLVSSDQILCRLTKFCVVWPNFVSSDQILCRLTKFCGLCKQTISQFLLPYIWLYIPV
jgi:hypothetical protein